MNHESEPHIVDSFLEELLGEKHPPDLRKSINLRLRSLDDAVPNHWNEALDRAQQDLNRDFGSASFLGESDSADRVLAADTRDSRRPVVEQATRSRRPRQYEVHVSPLPLTTGSKSTGLWWAAAIALTSAAMVFVAIGIRFQNPVKSHETDDQVLIAESPVPSDSVDSSISVPQLDATTNVPSLPIAESSSTEPEIGIESLPIATVPFAPTAPANTIAANTDPSENRDPPKAEAEIVEVIDSQFESLWKRLGLAQVVSIDSVDWASRATLAILGRPASEKELELALQVQSPSDKTKWLATLTCSPEFGAYWAKRLAENWIGTRQDGAPRLAFENWLADELNRGAALSDIQRQLLEARGSDEPDAPDFNPAAHWIVAGSAGGTRHLVDRFGRYLLGQSMACARCHDDQDGDFAMANYWGVYALLWQLETVREDRGDFNYWRVAQRSPKSVFYERPDGTQAHAIPTLPDRSPIDSTNDGEGFNQFTSWFANSHQRAARDVNIAWEVLLGSPLVPVYGLTDAEGAAERSQLNEFLTRQAMAHKEDLRSMVVWMAASQPFAMADSPDTDDTLAGFEDPALARKRDLVFAAFRRKDRDDRDTRDSRIRKMAAVFESNTSILSQPAPNVPGAKAIAAATDELAFRNMLTLPLPDKVEQHIEEWISHKLDWSLLVDHAMVLCDDFHPGDRDREFADLVLKNSEGKRQALTRLIKIYHPD